MSPHKSFINSHNWKAYVRLEYGGIERDCIEIAGSTRLKLVLDGSYLDDLRPGD